MKILAILVGLVMLMSPRAIRAEEAKSHSVAPKEGFVPDEQTAIQIAAAVWVPIYGKENIERQTPYNASLKNGVWHVSGSLPKGTKGGVAIAEIQKSDAKILRVSHGK